MPEFDNHAILEFVGAYKPRRPPLTNLVIGPRSKIGGGVGMRVPAFFVPTLFFLACGGDGPVVPQQAAVATVTITPSAPSPLVVGDSLALVATLRDAAGKLITGRTIGWASSNVAIAELAAAGAEAEADVVWVLGKGNGDATISATSEGRAISVVVQVRNPETPLGDMEIAFGTTRDGQWQVYRLRRDHSTGNVNVTRLTDHPGGSSGPHFSPDGSRIAFVSARDGDSEIYSMAASGADVRRLSSAGGGVGRPSWGGTKIAFSQQKTVSPFTSEVTVMNEDGTGAVVVTDQPGGNEQAWDYQPSVSPDGSMIALVSDRRCPLSPSCGTDIWVMNIDGTGAKNVTGIDEWADFAPAWSPDGNRIAFTSDRSGSSTWDIFVMDKDGRNRANVTNTPDIVEGFPSWSPNGTHLLFGTNQNGPQSEIYVIGLDGRGRLRLTDHPAEDHEASWRP